ncbi:unnamed protein product [Citrullus colocynthis]|uniref:Uncharacterized protein n=1 Tax=Citrullus colocynthis TaxID=252529 RepID=A0ABP0Y0K6_9ROSI
MDACLIPLLTYKVFVFLETRGLAKHKFYADAKGVNLFAHSDAISRRHFISCAIRENFDQSLLKTP